MDPTQLGQEGMSGGMQQGVSEAGQAPITEEQKQALIDTVKDIQGKLNDLKSLHFASDNKVDIIRRTLLKKVFEKLQAAGIDLNDRQSVADFLDKLRAETPEMAQMFESAMDVLLGGQGAAPQGTAEGVPPPSDMNNINPNEATPTAGV